MKRTCFVIMPIGDLTLDQNKFELFKEIYEDVIAPAVRVSAPDCECVRADEIKEIGSIIRDIVSQLCDADLVIADLTDKNPNVFYELGVRHALGKPTILISQRIDDVPFDLRPYRTIAYGISPRAIKKLESDLEQTIRNVFQGEQKPSSPVADFLDPSKINALLASLGRLPNRDLRPAEATIIGIEAKLEQLRLGQDRLSIEVDKLNRERHRVVKDIRELERLRTSTTEQLQYKEESTEPSKLSGLWRGDSGRMQLYVSDSSVSGDYDWNGYDMAGHIKGEFDGKILRFDWNWDKSPEEGNGFFLCDEDYTVLKGGWFFDHENVNLDEAIKGSNDKLIHPWAFERDTKGA